MRLRPVQNLVREELTYCPGMQESAYWGSSELEPGKVPLVLEHNLELVLRKRELRKEPVAAVADCIRVLKGHGCWYTNVRCIRGSQC